MGSIGLSVKIKGELPPDEEINTLIGIQATTIERKGSLIGSKKTRVFQTDTWTLDLTPTLNFDSSESEIKNKFLEAEILLKNIAKNIATLNRDRFSAALYVSCIREEEQGGLELSQELVIAIAIAKMQICVLILVVFPDE